MTMNMRLFFKIPAKTLILGLLFAGALAALAQAVEHEKPGKTRAFKFTYAFKVKNLPPGKPVRIWLPVPQTSSEQEVEIEAQELPAEGKMAHDRMYGNCILSMEAKANPEGIISASLTYKILRREVRTAGAKAFIKPGAKEKIARFLEADVKVPAGGKPLELLRAKEVPDNQVEAGKVFYDLVNRHMKYSKAGSGWGQGDAVWACDSKFGNCTDFHSLFISLARGHKIPAKFEIGFPLPLRRGAGKLPGYHCWAWFLPDGKGWVPVDISEANRNPDMADYYFGNLTEDRVSFSTGRDVELVPRQQGRALNFFIYPYVELGGQPYPARNIDSTYSFRDLP